MIVKLTITISLLYCALRILLRRPYLTCPIKALRDKHRGICLTHSQKIHAIHTLYARTFPHRLMTYQVSYCIYIAATVEALELKSPSNKPAREAAAARLAAAVRILQNEASHTPGSGKSLDTIRRLLSAGQQPPSVPQQRKSGPVCAPGSGFVQNSDDYADTELYADAVDNDDIEETPNGQPQSRKPGMGVEAEATVSARAVHGQPGEDNGSGISASVRQLTAHGGDDYQSMATTGHQSPILGDESSFLAGGSGTAWNDGFGIYGGTDTGAGFHPDAFPWRVSDLFPKMPNLAGQNWDQGWAEPAFSPRDSSQH